MPAALTIVMIFMTVVAILTWFVPTSVVIYDDDGSSSIIYNAAFDDEGNVIYDAGTNPAGIWDLFTAPIKGFVNAAEVATSILVSGGMLAILAHVGALDAGIGALLRRFKGSSLIAILMIVFALMGTIYGAWEELPAYAIVIVPLFISAGYDAITGMLVILIGAVVGNMSDIVNPYAIGAAVAAIGNDDLSIGDGILLRITMFVVLLSLGIFLVLRYAKKVKNCPESSPVYGIEINIKSEHGEEIPELNTKRKWSLIVFGIVILFCVMGYVPWDSIHIGDGTAFDIINKPKFISQDTFFGKVLGARGFTEFAWWYFVEFSAIWTLGALVIGIINKMPEKEWVSVFTKGCMDLTGVVLVLSAARGISVFMGSGTEGMSITFIYWIKGLMTGVPLWAFAIAAVAAYMCIGIFLQSTSAVSGITMPIFGAVALALFAASEVGAEGGQAMLMSAFTLGINFISGIYPESTNMGIMTMTNVPYNIFLKQWLKILLPILLVGILIISAAPYIGLV